MTITLAELRGKSVISADAFIVGEITDIRYDTKWNVIGLKTRTEKSIAKKIPSIGSGRSMIRIAPADFTINDVVLMKERTCDIGPMITVDTDNASSLSTLEDKKVVSSNGVVIGTVQNINVDTDLWSVPTISVKLDKMAFEPLGLKKGILSKTIISIRTEYIATATDVIMLNQGIEDIREDLVVE